MLHVLFVKWILHRFLWTFSWVVHLTCVMFVNQAVGMAQFGLPFHPGRAIEMINTTSGNVMC